MQYYQIIINNLTILQNTTQYYSIFYSINNTTQYCSILQSITCSKSSCLLRSQSLSYHEILARHCSFSWKNIWENWMCVFRKWKDCKGFLCFAKHKQIAVQLLVMQNSIYLDLAQNIQRSNSEDMNTFAASFWWDTHSNIKAMYGHISLQQASWISNIMQLVCNILSY